MANGATNAPIFRFKPGDSLKVVVLGFPDYVADYVVLSDGTISGIGFGQIKAQGMSVAELEREIQSRMRKLVREPKIAVVVTQEKQQNVFVVRGDDGGASSTATSGGFPFVPGMELRQLIALSRMPSPLDMFETRVYRNGALFQTVNLDELMKGGAQQWNGPLQPNDLVTIMPIPLVRVWVLGLVGAPGEKRIRAGSDVYQAIASAGAITADPAKFGELEVVVRRGPDIFTFSPQRDIKQQSFTVESGDTILVQPPTLLQVSVAGFVTRPGDFEVRPGTTVSQVIGATAGGVTPDGTLKGVLVFRRNEVLVVDALPEGNAKPLPLESGDAVFVLRNQRLITVLGEVTKPGSFAMVDDREYRLADALATAGGLSERGSLRRAYVLKPENGKMVARQYNLDEYLKDGKLEANPKLAPGDVVLFGQPKGITAQGISQVLSGALILDNLFRR